ncbi:hypothetical protein [Streptomyces phaeochromogenes]|nr:hypothetical protein OG437_24235 [Streptomyces phaeochromogenes]
MKTKNPTGTVNSTTLLCGAHRRGRQNPQGTQGAKAAQAADVR